jgi:hypothetical protein
MTVIIHAHPRTGSTSLFNYLAKAIGILTPKGTEGVRRVHYLVNEKAEWYTKLYRGVIERIGKENCIPITIRRDPVDTNVSLFWYRTRYMEGVEPTPENALEMFMKSIDHFSPVRHFKEEVQAFWGDHPRLLVLDFKEIYRWPEILQDELQIPFDLMPHDLKTQPMCELRLPKDYQALVRKYWEET